MTRSQVAFIRGACGKVAAARQLGRHHSRRPPRTPSARHRPPSQWLAVTLYYLATVAEAFGPRLDETIESLDATDLLARARATLGIDADIAGELVSRFRSERGLPLLT
jgi:hypothetical protein